MHIALKFQFDRVCFQRELEARANVGVTNNTVSVCLSNADIKQYKVL